MNKIDGRYLRDLREERGYSLREFSQKIYVSKSSVQRWEQSSVPENADVLSKIAEVFDTTVEEMRSRSHNKYGNKPAEDEEVDQEQLAEIKFGVKKLTATILIMFATSAILLLIIMVAFLFV